MRSTIRARAVFFAFFAIGIGALAFACGSDEDPKCEGAACIDSGGSESSTPEGSTSDAPPGDAPNDSPNESGEAGACKPEALDADAGPSGALQWALNFGVSGFTFPSAIARDPSNGDIVVTGYFWGTTDFGGGPLTSVALTDGSGSDTFVARFDRNGAYKWAGAWGNGSNFGANAVAVGPKGEMVVGGTIREGSIDFGNGCDVLTSTGFPDAFLVQFDKAGICMWSKRFGAAGQTQNINNLAIDPAGGIFLAGASSGGLDFGGGPLTGLVLAKLTTAGAHVWSKSFAAPTSYGGPWVALDASGNAILGGNTHTPSIDLGGGPRTSPNGDGGTQPSAAFIAKFDPSGKHVWSRRYAHFSTISGPLATDRCGNVVVHGGFFGAVDFGGGPLSGVDGANNYAFIAKLTTNGTGIWSKSFAGSNGGNGNVFGLGSVTISGTGRATIAPRLSGGIGFQSTTDFGGGPITSAGRGSIAIATFDEAGKYAWAHGGGAPSTATASFASFPTAAAAWGSSVTIAAAFNNCTTVCSTAPVGTTLVLAGRTLNAVSGQDLVIANFTP